MFDLRKFSNLRAETNGHVAHDCDNDSNNYRGLGARLAALDATGGSLLDLRLLLTPLSEMKKTTTMVVNGRLVQPRRSRVAAAPLQAIASSFAFAICMTR